MTAQHTRTRAKRYNTREQELKARRHRIRNETACLECGDTVHNPGSELCDRCEINHWLAGDS